MESLEVWEKSIADYANQFHPSKKQLNPSVINGSTRSLPQYEGNHFSTASYSVNMFPTDTPYPIWTSEELASIQEVYRRCGV